MICQRHITGLRPSSQVPLCCTPAPRQEIGPETPRSDVRMVSVDDAYEMVVNGTIVDAKTMVAILRLKSGTLDHLND